MNWSVPLKIKIQDLLNIAWNITWVFVRSRRDRTLCRGYVTNYLTNYVTRFYPWRIRWCNDVQWRNPNLNAILNRFFPVPLISRQNFSKESHWLLLFRRAFLSPCHDFITLNTVFLRNVKLPSITTILAYNTLRLCHDIGWSVTFA